MILTLQLINFQNFKREFVIMRKHLKELKKIKKLLYLKTDFGSNTVLRDLVDSIFQCKNQFYLIITF